MKHNIRIEKRQLKIHKSKITEIQTKKGIVKVWTEKENIDNDEVKLLVKLTKLDHIFEHIAVLPDFHIGGILMNGTVLPSIDSVYVNAIGGDVGCGMSSLMLPFSRGELLGQEEKLYKLLYQNIPTGRRTHSEISNEVDKIKIFSSHSQLLTHKVTKKLKLQMGTVGDGNHFVELQQNNEGKLHILVHSGSRYLGQVMKEFYSRHIPDMKNNQLYALSADSETGKMFLNDHDLALEYAKENRKQILMLVLRSLQIIINNDFSIDELSSQINDFPHNFISQEEFDGKLLYIHRKGAQRVKLGEIGIIPGDMANPSFLVEGKGYKLTYNSCSHGAGRKISRGKALQTVNYEEFRNKVQDVVCRTDRNVLDEAPQAYKEIIQVIKYQRDIVKQIDIFMPLINIKG